MAQMAVWPMCLHAGYLRLQTHSEYVICIDFSLQQWLDERTSVLRYTYITSFVTPGFNYCSPFRSKIIFQISAVATGAS